MADEEQALKTMTKAQLVVECRRMRKQVRQFRAREGKSMSEPARPTLLDVGGHLWSVSWDDEDTWARVMTEDGVSMDTARGYQDSIEHTIHMRTWVGRRGGGEASVGALQLTFVHEMLHAVNRVSAVDLNVDEQSEDVEEWLCQLQSAPLLALMRSNPIAMRWLAWKEI